MMRVVLLIWLLSVAAWANTAMVGDVKGPATVDGTQLRALDTLSEGQKITLEEGAKVTLMFKGDGLRQRLAGPGVATVSKSGVTPKSLVAREMRPKKRKSARVPDGLNLDRMAAIRTRVVGTSEGKVEESLALMGVPQFREPDSTITRSVLEPNPTFQWMLYGDEAFAGYELVVFGHSTQKIVSGRSVRLEKPLSRGQSYQVMLTGTRADGTRSVPSVITYRVLSSEQAQRLAELAQSYRQEFQAQPDDPSPILVLASVYAENQLLEQALTTLRDVVEQRPQDNNLKLALGDLYFQSGMTGEAKKYYELAGVR